VSESTASPASPADGVNVHASSVVSSPPPPPPLTSPIGSPAPAPLLVPTLAGGAVWSHQDIDSLDPDTKSLVSQERKLSLRDFNPFEIVADTAGAGAAPPSERPTVVHPAGAQAQRRDSKQTIKPRIQQLNQGGKQQDEIGRRQSKGSGLGAAAAFACGPAGRKPSDGQWRRGTRSPRDGPA
jgi:hypothetical protein